MSVDYIREAREKRKKGQIIFRDVSIDNILDQAAALRARAERAEQERDRAIDENTALLGALNRIYLAAVVAPSLIDLQKTIAAAFDSVWGPAHDAGKE